MRQQPPTPEAIRSLLSHLFTHGPTRYRNSPHGGFSRPVSAHALALGLVENVSAGFTAKKHLKALAITEAGIAYLHAEPPAELIKTYDLHAEEGWLHNGTWYEHLWEITEEGPVPAEVNPRMNRRLAQLGAAMLSGAYGTLDPVALTYAINQGIVTRTPHLAVTPLGRRILGSNCVVTPELVRLLTGSTEAPKRAYRNSVGEVSATIAEFIENNSHALTLATG